MKPKGLDVLAKSSWSAEKAWQWYERQPLIVGVNYLPSNAVNSTDFWQSLTFDKAAHEKEIGWASQYGYNAVRVFMPFLVWKHEPEKLMEHFDIFLGICLKHGIKVVPVLFDDCAFSDLEPYLGPQRLPVPRMHNSGWTPSPGQTLMTDPGNYPELKRYVTAMVSRHADDERILFWDLYNEPGNNHMGSKSLFLVEQAFHWARACDPSQPLTVGIWGFTNQMAPADVAFIDMIAFQYSDILSYHHYGRPHEMLETMKSLKTLGYPVICTEWMARVYFECTIEQVFPMFIEHGIGSMHWGLVNGKTQTHIPWGWKPEDGEPAVWFHDVLHGNGEPYDHHEMKTIKNRRKEQ